jgi:very-short-patch-repair endonuclease
VATGVYCLPGAERADATRAVSLNVEPEELLALVPVSGRWAGRVRKAVGLADASAQSVLESAARVLMVEGGVGSVETQVEIDRVGWVDFLVDGWLVVETDGYATHRTAFREDRRRDAELLRAGYLVLRFTYADVEGRPQWVLDVIRDTLRREGPAHAARHRRARDR